MRPLQAAAAYFAIVFGAGFILGVARVVFLVPRVGTRVAELLEMPLMLVVVLLAASWVNRHLADRGRSGDRLQIGLLALIQLVVAECVLGMALRGLTLWQALFDRDPVAGTAYYLSLALFALMPWILDRLRHRDRGVASLRRPA